MELAISDASGGIYNQIIETVPIDEAQSMSVFLIPSLSPQIKCGSLDHVLDISGSGTQAGKQQAKTTLGEQSCSKHPRQLTRVRAGYSSHQPSN